jgi:hypothetical protein
MLLLQLHKFRNPKKFKSKWNDHSIAISFCQHEVGFNVDFFFYLSVSQEKPLLKFRYSTLEIFQRAAAIEAMIISVCKCG